MLQVRLFLLVLACFIAIVTKRVLEGLKALKQIEIRSFLLKKGKAYEMVQNFTKNR